ncbi:peptidoglycan-binding protein [Neisseria sp. Ec49-e6-T10]|uniref:peptidoglycan-binding protein n=1 Tax=Neisseria sp. Ec49-e6-T10 TaxID=3140744 RepID=UPI003EBECA29
MADIYTNMVQQRGAAYRDSQIKSYSHYREPIDHSAGRLAGNSRIWGDASPEVQSRVIDTLISACDAKGLNNRETAYVLAIARIESGFNPDAAAGTTSAFGLGQFINDTGKSYGINSSNRYDVAKQAEALVAHYIDNRDLAKRRGQSEEYIYGYHHDGPSLKYGGVDLAKNKVLPYLKEYEGFVSERRQNVEIARDNQNINQQAVQPELSLQMGSRGKEVEHVQEQLRALGFQDSKGRDLSTDNIFGSNTKFALENFQRQNGLTVNGVVGRETAEKLEQAYQQQLSYQKTQGAHLTESKVDGHERILRSGIAGFDLGTGSKPSVASVKNPNAQYEYSQNGRDKGNSDRDNFKEVDCSSLVYYALKNAGYRVDQQYPNLTNNSKNPNLNGANFTTKALFNGENLTGYAKQNFDSVKRNEAQIGDLVLFKHGNTQHVGIVTEVNNGKPVAFYGAQTSTGPAVAPINNAYWKPENIVGIIRPKDSFYDPSRDLTKSVPEGFDKRYEQIKTREISPSNNPGKPSYPLLDNSKSWGHIKTQEASEKAKDQNHIPLEPKVQAIKERLDVSLKPDLTKAGVSAKHSDAMVATTTCECVKNKIDAKNIIHVGINYDQNKLFVTTHNKSVFISVDAVHASKQNPNEQLDMANKISVTIQINAQQSEKNMQNNLAQEQQNNMVKISM